jgi:hypothetical protein
MCALPFSLVLRACPELFDKLRRSKDPDANSLEEGKCFLLCLQVDRLPSGLRKSQVSAQIKGRHLIRLGCQLWLADDSKNVVGYPQGGRFSGQLECVAALSQNRFVYVAPVPEEDIRGIIRTTLTSVNACHLRAVFNGDRYAQLFHQYH